MQAARPAKPAEFMIQFLQSNYIKRDNKRKSCEDAADDDEEISTEEEELQSPVFLSSPESDSPQFNSTSPFERPNTYIVVPDSLKRRRRGMPFLHIFLQHTRQSSTYIPYIFAALHPHHPTISMISHDLLPFTPFHIITSSSLYFCCPHALIYSTTHTISNRNIQEQYAVMCLV